MIHLVTDEKAIGFNSSEKPNPFFKPWKGTPGKLFANPGGVSTEQVDPGFRSYRLYTWTYATGATFGQILVARTNYTSGSTRFLANTEYFSLTAASPGTQSLISSMQELDWPASGTVPGFPTSGALATFSMPVSVTWDRARSDPQGVLTCNAGGTVICIQWNLTYSGGAWGGNLTWFQSAVKGNRPKLLSIPDGTISYSAGPVNEPTGQVWFSTVVTPTN